MPVIQETDADISRPIASATQARDAGYALCLTCNQLNLLRGPEYCLRCHAPVRARKPESLTRTWALVVTALILLVPANTIPMMEVLKFGKHDPSTILSGIIKLWLDKQFMIAVIVFVASFVVPIFKIASLIMLLLAANRSFPMRPERWTRLYRFLEFIGRWSMLDVFVVTLLVSLVQLGNISRVIAGGGSFAFTLVVVLTMLASLSFDPRLLWDSTTEKKAS